jgi:hypothetical protein
VGLVALAAAFPTAALASLTLPVALNESVLTTEDGVYLVRAVDPECGAPGTAVPWTVATVEIASTADLGETVLPVALRTAGGGGVTDIFVGASAAYDGLGLYTASSRIYRIDGVTGLVSELAELEDFQTDVFAPDPEATAGIAGLAYRADLDLLYASYLKDGRIYVLDAATGGLQSVFDPFASYLLHATEPIPGTLYPDRTVGLGWNAVEERLYYGVWQVDQSTAAKGASNFVFSQPTDVLGNVVLDVPFPHPLEILLPSNPDAGFSSPPWDLAFDASGTRMLIGARSMDGVLGDLSPGASAVLEYVGSHFAWGGLASSPSGNDFLVGPTGLYASGGVDYDGAVPDACNAGRHVVAASDHLGSPEVIYGLQVMDESGADVLTGFNAVVESGYQGDVDTCPSCPPRPNELQCYDEHDGDGDGLVDCEDPDCANTVACGDFGCTWTQGYWKNHNHYATRSNRHIPWPISEDTAYFSCAETWYTILQQNSGRGGGGGGLLAQLGQQYVAARLNLAMGASATPEVLRAVDDLEVILFDCEVSSDERADGLAAMEILDDYNNGRLGPGHCDGKHGEPVPLSIGERPEPAAGCSTTGSPSAPLWLSLLSLFTLGTRRRGGPRSGL